jgi:hypothetical protein
MDSGRGDHPFALLKYDPETRKVIVLSKLVAYIGFFPYFLSNDLNNKMYKFLVTM